MSHASQGGQASDQASKRAPGRHRPPRSDKSLERHPTGSSLRGVTNEEHRHQPDKSPRRAPNRVTVLTPGRESGVVVGLCADLAALDDPLHRRGLSGQETEQSIRRLFRSRPRDASSPVRSSSAGATSVSSIAFTAYVVAPGGATRQLLLRTHSSWLGPEGGEGSPLLVKECERSGQTSARARLFAVGVTPSRAIAGNLFLDRLARAVSGRRRRVPRSGTRRRARRPRGGTSGVEPRSPWLPDGEPDSVGSAAVEEQRASDLLNRDHRALGVRRRQAREEGRVRNRLTVQGPGRAGGAPDTPYATLLGTFAIAP